jgi:ferredoxin
VVTDGRPGPHALLHRRWWRAVRYHLAMRVVVDFLACESNALCVGAVPEVFELDDNDNLVVLMEEPPEELRERLRQAERSCPKQAISIQED